MRLSHWYSGRVNEAVHRMRLNLTIHLDVTICLSLHEPRLFHFGGVSQHSREHAMNIFRDLTKLRRRRQGERQKNNRFNEQNNNSARASRFFVHFFAVSAQQRCDMTTL